MEEIEQLHNLNLEWGCITNLMDKISTIEDSIEGGWPELIDMVADAVTEEGEAKDPVSAFFNLYQFLWRLYYRVKANPEKRKFNEYSKQGEEYWITNYDFKAFKWAKRKEALGGLDNLVIRIPEDKLTADERRVLNRRCK